MSTASDSVRGRPLTTTNSSAPSLPTVSSWPTAARTRSAIASSTRSPVSWPRLSLNCLKPSMSQHHRAVPRGTLPEPTVRAARRSTSACRFNRSVRGSWVARCTRPACAARVAVTSSKMTSANGSSTSAVPTTVEVATTVSSTASWRRSLTSPRTVVAGARAPKSVGLMFRNRRSRPTMSAAGTPTSAAKASFASRTSPTSDPRQASRAVGTGDRVNTC